jgi:hypothetical protein
MTTPLASLPAGQIVGSASGPLYYGATAPHNDALADNMVCATLATRKPLVVQGAAAQSANLQEWQSSAGTALASVSSAGLLTVPNLTLSAAGLITVPLNTAAALTIQDTGNNAYYTLDSRTTASGVTANLLGNAGPSIASAAGVTYHSVGVAAFTVTLSGDTTVNSLGGLQLNIASPTISNNSDLVVTSASTVSVNGPLMPDLNDTLTYVTVIDIPQYAAQNATTASCIRLNAPNTAGANFSLDIVNGNINMGGNNFNIPANTAAAVAFKDANNIPYWTIDTRSAVSGLKTYLFSAPNLNLASAAGLNYSKVSISSITATVSGVTTVTAMPGVSLLVSSPTITNVSAGLVVTTVSAVQINGPLLAGNATSTTAIALDLPTYVGTGTTACALRLALPTGATNNYALRIGTPGTEDSTADNIIFSSATTQTPLVIQAIASQSDNMQEWQISTGVARLIVTSAGNVVTRSSNFYAWSSTTDANVAPDTSIYRKGIGAIAFGTGAASGVGTVSQPANTAAALTISDGTNAYITINTQTATDNTVDITLGNSASTYASAAGSTHSLLKLNSYTLTYTGGTNVTTNEQVLSLAVGAATITSASATVITSVASVNIAGPLPAGSVTFTNSFAQDSSTWVTNGTLASGIRVAAPSGATTNYSLLWLDASATKQGALEGSKGIILHSANLYTWGSSVLATPDTGLSRLAPASVAIGNGNGNDVSGTLNCTTVTHASGNLTVSTTTSGDIILSPAGDIKWGKALVANGGGAGTFLLDTHGAPASGPQTLTQNAWMQAKDSGGNTMWIPVWK